MSIFLLKFKVIKMKNFKVTRIFADEKGESHFEEIKIKLQDKGQIGFLSELEEAVGIIFRKVQPEYDFDFHKAPHRQYIILQDGSIEIETSLGEKRIFEQGDVLLVEDTFGKGHRTKNLQKALRSSIFVILE
jgi:quercetin dioxygenase-like cupin family protein